MAIGREAGEQKLTFHFSQSDHQRRRELIAFARYCTERITRGLGARAAWDIAIEPASDGFTALVRARVQAAELQATSCAADPMVAMWHAICDIEQPVRDAAAIRVL